MTSLSLGAIGFVSMKKLLRLAAVLEVVTGLTLIVDPSLVVRLLLLDEDVSGAGLAVSRLLGIALLSSGFGCWPEQSAAGRVSPTL
jgi:hypothetical protein